MNRKHWPPYPPKVKKEALRRLREGRDTVPVICEALGMKESTLRVWACEQQISLRGRGGKSQRVSGGFAQRDQQIAEAARSGATQEAIGASFRLSRARIGQILRALGGRRKRALAKSKAGVVRGSAAVQRTAPRITALLLVKAEALCTRLARGGDAAGEKVVRTLLGFAEARARRSR